MSIIINDGSTTPSVAHTEPATPATSSPTYVATFTANEPGVLSLTAIKLIISCSLIQPCATTSLSTRGSIA